MGWRIETISIMVSATLESHNSDGDIRDNKLFSEFMEDIERLVDSEKYQAINMMILSMESSRDD